MNKLEIYFKDEHIGILREIEGKKKSNIKKENIYLLKKKSKITKPDIYYEFQYDSNYKGVPISLTMPLSRKKYLYNIFPPFFDNLLPEGGQLKALLKNHNLSEFDYLGQIAVVGGDLVGAVTVKIPSVT